MIFVVLVLNGLTARLAAYRGLNPAPGPKGVGKAVNQTVVISFVSVMPSSGTVCVTLFRGRRVLVVHGGVITSHGGVIAGMSCRWWAVCGRSDGYASRNR